MDGEGGRDGALSEQLLAGAEQDREDLQPELVDEVVLEHGLDEVAAAVDLQLRAIFPLELPDLRRYVAANKDGRLPVGINRPVRNDVLRRLVDAGARLVVALRPVAGEDVVGLMAEEQVEGGWPICSAITFPTDTICRGVSLSQGHIANRLRRLLLASTLEILRLSGMAFSVTSLQTALDQFRIFDRLEEAVKVGDVGAEEANQWRGWLQAADEANRLFVAPVLFQAIARKPASPLGT